MSDASKSSEQASETQNQEQNQNKESVDDKLDRIKGDRVAHFASLLDESDPRGNEEEEDEEEEEESTGDEDKDKDKDKDKGKGELKTLTDLAKKLGVKQSELYNVKLTLKDQETNISLGELKDFYQDSDDLGFQKIEWGEQKAKEEQELARGRRELEVLVSLVPKESLNKETLKQAAEIVQGQLERSRKDVLRRIPDWEDKEVRKGEVEKINEHLSKYGVTLSELTDSRLVHYIRNTWLREMRIEEALAKVRKVESKKTGDPSASSDRRNKRTTGRKVSPRARQIARNFLNEMEE